MINHNTSNRFANVSHDEINDMLKKKRTKNTHSSTKVAANVLKKYCEETGKGIDFENYSSFELNNILMNFYVAARTEKGEHYKINSMRGIRSGLQRYFMEEINPIFDIILSADFTEANICFENVLKHIRSLGKGETSHYPEIEPEDLQKLYSSFDIEDPYGLQHKVWFDIMFQLVRRGRENLKAMKKNTFAVEVDATGKKYIYQRTGEADKNHNVNDNSFDTIGEGRIYETNTSKCPVKSFEKYLSHLNPACDSLWQRPRDAKYVITNVWYCNIPVGEKMLGNMMPNMCKKYSLSKRYTNHCLRVTSLQLLEDQNIEGRHIIRISGHKNVESIKSYARTLSTSRKRNISSILSSSIAPNDKESKSVTEPISVPPSLFNEFDDQLNKVDDNIFLRSIANDMLLGNNNPEMSFSSGHNSNFTPVFHNCKVTFNVNISK